MSSLRHTESALNVNVGYRNASGEYLALRMYMAGGAESPLMVSHAGLEIIQQNGDELGWEPDPLLHFECIEGRQSGLSFN